MNKMPTENIVVMDQVNLDDTARARQWFIEMMENGNRCNPQDSQGNLLESTDEIIAAFEKENG